MIIMISMQMMNFDVIRKRTFRFVWTRIIIIEKNKKKQYTAISPFFSYFHFCLFVSLNGILNENQRRSIKNGILLLGFKCTFGKTFTHIFFLTLTTYLLELYFSKHPFFVCFLFFFGSCYTATTTTTMVLSFSHSICGIGNHSILESLFHFIKIIIIVGWFLRLSQAATRSFISYNAKYYTMVHIKPNKQTNIK